MSKSASCCAPISATRRAFKLARTTESYQVSKKLATKAHDVSLARSNCVLSTARLGEGLENKPTRAKGQSSLF